MNCKKCGTPLTPMDRFCPECGTPAAWEEMDQTQTSGVQGRNQRPNYGAVPQRPRQYEDMTYGGHDATAGAYPGSAPAPAPRKPKSNKTLLIVLLSLLAAIVLAAGAVLWLTLGGQEQPVVTAQQSKNIGIVVVDAYGGETRCAFDTEEKLLLDALRKENLISGSETADGFEVRTVNGVAAERDQYWVCTRVGEHTDIRPDTCRILDGDVYKFTLKWAETEETTEEEATEEVAEEVVEEAVEEVEEVKTGGYLLPYSDTRVVTQQELSKLTHEELCFARNEIYARHGRMFTHPEVKAYFDAQSWYHGTIPASSFNANVLNSVEKENIAIIQNYEAQFGGSYY